MRHEGDARWKTLGIAGLELHYLPWKYLKLSNKILTIAGAVVIVLALLMMLAVS